MTKLYVRVFVILQFFCDEFLFASNIHHATSAPSYQSAYRLIVRYSEEGYLRSLFLFMYILIIVTVLFFLLIFFLCLAC